MEDDLKKVNRNNIILVVLGVIFIIAGVFKQILLLGAPIFIVAALINTIRWEHLNAEAEEEGEGTEDTAPPRVSYVYATTPLKKEKTEESPEEEV